MDEATAAAAVAAESACWCCWCSVAEALAGGGVMPWPPIVGGSTIGSSGSAAMPFITHRAALRIQSSMTEVTSVALSKDRATLQIQAFIPEVTSVALQDTQLP